MAWFRCGGVDTSELEQQIAQKDQQINDLNGQISQKDQQISDLKNQNKVSGDDETSGWKITYHLSNYITNVDAPNETVYKASKNTFVLDNSKLKFRYAKVISNIYDFGSDSDAISGELWITLNGMYGIRVQRDNNRRPQVWYPEPPKIVDLTANQVGMGIPNEIKIVGLATSDSLYWDTGLDVTISFWGQQLS